MAGVGAVLSAIGGEPVADAAALQKLREPFPPTSIGYLPRVWCKACRESSNKHCQQHSILAKCPKCGNKITNAHLDLEYVGHAEVTDRLLTVDPSWTWEPMATDSNGNPIVTERNRMLEMWIRLTICGVTRPGVGIVENHKAEAAKELISDALRNGCMRFGVALDLWAKNDLESQISGAVAADGNVPPPAPDTTSSGGDSTDDPHLPSGPPVTSAGVTSPPGESAPSTSGTGTTSGEEATEPVSSVVSDPLDRVQGIEGVNKRVKALSKERRALWFERKPAPGPTFVAEALTVLDELDRVAV